MRRESVLRSEGQGDLLRGPSGRSGRRSEGARRSDGLDTDGHEPLLARNGLLVMIGKAERGLAAMVATPRHAVSDRDHFRIGAWWLKLVGGSMRRALSVIVTTHNVHLLDSWP